MDQVKTDEKIERNKTKWSTYLIRTVNCLCDKNSNNNKNDINNKSNGNNNNNNKM